MYIADNLSQARCNPGCNSTTHLEADLEQGPGAWLEHT